MELSIELGVELERVLAMPVRHAALYAQVYRLRAKEMDEATGRGPDGSDEALRAQLTARAQQGLQQQPRAGRR